MRLLGWSRWDANCPPQAPGCPSASGGRLEVRSTTHRQRPRTLHRLDFPSQLSAQFFARLVETGNGVGGQPQSIRCLNASVTLLARVLVQWWREVSWHADADPGGLLSLEGARAATPQRRSRSGTQTPLSEEAQSKASSTDIRLRMALRPIAAFSALRRQFPSLETIHAAAQSPFPSGRPLSAAGWLLSRLDRCLHSAGAGTGCLGCLVVPLLQAIWGTSLADSVCSSA